MDGGKRGIVEGREEDCVTVLGDLAVIPGTPEECCLQAATFERDSISPAKATFTPSSVSSVMGGFLMRPRMHSGSGHWRTLVPFQSSTT